MTIYGQEKDNATWALSKMNMILHGNETAEIYKGDTITNPQLTNGTRLKTFDYVVIGGGSAGAAVAEIAVVGGTAAAIHRLETEIWRCSSSAA